MFGFKPPLKIMIVKSLLSLKNTNASDIYDYLKHDYGHEKQFCIENIEYHLQALKVVGIVQISNISLDTNEKLIVQYNITQTGERMISTALL